jgi:hypothetical protein
MKKLFTLVLIISGFSSTSDAFASRVFKCVDTDGVTHFSFKPCPKRIVKFSTRKAPEQTYQYHMEMLDQIDDEMATLHRRSRELRQDMKANLIADVDTESHQRFLVNYKDQVNLIAREMKQLKARRTNHVESSMSLLSQAY